MSDTSQGEGWWLASDGKWYPPQAASVAAPPPPPGVVPPPLVQPTKPKKPLYKRVWFWLVIVALLLGGCIGIVSVGVNQANTQKHSIVYLVTGTVPATITYSAYDRSNEGTSQVSGVSLPWTKTITGSGLFNSYDLTATLGSTGGSVTCKILIDGKKVASNTATGAFSSAMCSGSAA